ncbi:MAG: carbon storage regulator [Candidatus Kerfeldbacteria bacterium]|nr:carbon storage regulator [Candidatus Kerfeldbacteria bacterium]
MSNETKEGYLVLTRRAGEEIQIGESVLVKVFEIRRGWRRLKHGRVKIGIKAPPEVNVRRTELPISEGRPPPSKPEPGP